MAALSIRCKDCSTVLRLPFEGPREALLLSTFIMKDDSTQCVECGSTQVFSSEDVFVADLVREPGETTSKLVIFPIRS